MESHEIELEGKTYQVCVVNLFEPLIEKRNANSSSILQTKKG